MKNKTYYLGKMTYHKRSTDFELSYLIEKNIKEFSFLKEYESLSGLVPHKTVFDSYLIKMDELNMNKYIIILKSLKNNNMYCVPVSNEFSESIANGDLESPYIGEYDKFILEFGSIKNFSQITY